MAARVNLEGVEDWAKEVNILLLLDMEQGLG